MITAMLKATLKSGLAKLGFSLNRTFSESAKLYEDYPSESLREKRFYNIGAGNFFHKYWTNIDYGSSWYSNSQKNTFIDFDLMSLSELPIETATGQIVYSSHTIEHITDEQLVIFSVNVTGFWFPRAFCG